MAKKKPLSLQQALDAYAPIHPFSPTREAVERHLQEVGSQPEALVWFSATSLRSGAEAGVLSDIQSAAKRFVHAIERGTPTSGPLLQLDRALGVYERAANRRS